MTAVASVPRIGIFDSGLGGLAIYRQVRRLLPSVDLVYIADSGYGPYGDKRPAYIESRVRQLGNALVDLNACAIVVACNTATVTSIGQLRAEFGLPIIGVEPGIKPAVELTGVNRIAVLATKATLNSRSVVRLCEQFGAGISITLIPAFGLVERVERGDISSAKTRALIKQYCQQVRHSGADTVVLGCTHYIFLEAQFRALIGRGVSLVEPSRAVAEELLRRVGASLPQSSPSRPCADQFFTTAVDCAQAATAMSRLLGRTVMVKNLADQQGGAQPRENSTAAVPQVARI